MSEPLSVYVHVPYCRVICPYCDFNVHRAAGMPEDRYVDALIAEVDHAAADGRFAARPVATLYLGGGTPSLFAPASIARILGAIRGRFAAAETPPEITLEANPENLEPERLRAYREAGVDRLSIGIQSFDPRHLRTLGRAATAEDAVHAVARARDAGFANLSLDLMFAVPGQTLDDWRQDLALAIEARPEHVSAYGLTYEPGTPFTTLRAERRLSAADEDLEADMFRTTRATLSAAGYIPYEISNFARPGHESRHNRNYWRSGDYLGLGAGAHSHVRSGETATRWWNQRSPTAYIASALATGEAVDAEEHVDRQSSATETIFLGLRTREGLDRGAFKARFAIEPEEMFPALKKLTEDGFLESDPKGFRLSDRGILIADEIIATAI